MQKNNIPQKTSSITTWLSYLENLHDKAIDMELERISYVATRLKVLPPAPFVFTVAGTNGKGTTCRTLEAVLIASGYSVGVYNSPHLICYNERVRIQGSELPDSAHITSFIAIETARNNIPLTYFEFSTLAALWLFKKAHLDIVILEVGLGGRLDATNIVDNDVAVITNIALDHIDWLGTERGSIGREKAGIFRANKPAIVGDILGTPKSIMQVAQEKNAQLLRYGNEWNFITTNENSWNFKDTQGEILNLPLPHVPKINAATALAALRASKLRVAKQAIHKGITSAVLPGRFQIISKSPRLILDVAHNPHAATYLAEQLKELPNTKRILAVIAMLYDKDIAGTILCMKKIVNYWYCAPLHEPRGASAEYLIKHVCKGKTYTSVTHAWHAAMAAAQPEDTVLVFGSFHTVAHVIEAIKSKNNK